MIVFCSHHDRDALAKVLAEHYLVEIVCDHEREADNPRCACSREWLGWHPSVGAAVRAWVSHVLHQLGAGDAQ